MAGGQTRAQHCSCGEGTENTKLGANRGVKSLPDAYKSRASSPPEVSPALGFQNKERQPGFQRAEESREQWEQSAGVQRLEQRHKHSSGCGAAGEEAARRDGGRRGERQTRAERKRALGVWGAGGWGKGATLGKGFASKGSTHQQPGSGMWQLAPCSVTSLPCLHPTPWTLT